MINAPSLIVSSGILGAIFVKLLQIFYVVLQGRVPTEGGQSSEYERKSLIDIKEVS